jgi:HK97 family phage major capsid protein
MAWWPSGILMHPEDVTALDLLKIADGRYIDIPYYDGEKQTVIRVPIYMNTGITQDEFLIGDFSKAKAFVRDELAIRIYDQNEDDAIRNRATVTGNIRLAFRIKNQTKAAFVKGDFTTAISALAKP